MNNCYKVGALTCLLSLLVGCGGSSSKSQPGSSSSSVLKISGDLAPSVNQSVALIATLEHDMSELASIKWTQSSGANVDLSSAHTAVFAFDLVEAGDYSFSVEYTTKAGTRYNETIDFTNQAEPNQLRVRREHSVREGNKVSFKLSAPTDDSGNVVAGEYGAMTWQQTTGPTVVFNSQNTNTMTQLFTAPKVTGDTVLTFTVSATHPNGEVFTDQVHLLVQDTVAVEDNLFEKYQDIITAKVWPYNPNSKYANAIVDCVYSNSFTFANRCATAKLPLIGQQTLTPTIDDVMDRVVVSHPWMGDNFKQFLLNEDMSGDFLLLLRSVNAIVLSYDIRPSFYWSATGAIYLDPDNLWLTPAQRDVIDVAPDYRGAFGLDLQYLMPWRYVKNNEYASSFYAPDLRIDRTTSDLIPELGALLYHELAHSNDAFPSNTFNDISNLSLYDEYAKRSAAKTTVSERLLANLPKNSAEMAALALVNFHGDAANQTQKNYSPGDITSFFSNDVAAMEYGYSSIREDTATLFDATMMSVRFGIQRDVAVTDSPENATSETIIVDWGQRGRVNAPGVAVRTRFVLNNLTPDFNSAEIMALLPATQMLPPGFNWKQVLNPDNPTASAKSAIGTKIQQRMVARQLALDLKVRHR